MKRSEVNTGDELRPEYDLRQLLKAGVRGKYAKRYQAGTHLVLLKASKPATTPLPSGGILNA